jgi:hypothetical protein
MYASRGKKAIMQKIILDNQTLEQVSNFGYLG